MTDKDVFLYALSTCPWCRKTKQFFKEKNIPFEFVDYDLADFGEQDRIVANMKKYTDHISFPFVLIGEAVVQGYNPEKYELLLKKNSGSR